MGSPLQLSTLEYQKPNIVFFGLEIFDSGEGTMALIEDKQIQKGKMVKVKLVVQNIGFNIALNSKLSIISKDEDIYLENNQHELGDLKAGEVKEIWFTMSPNKRVKSDDQLPIYLTVTEDVGYGSLKDKLLPLTFGQKPPKTEIVDITADYESLTKNVAVFEYESNKIIANTGSFTDISRVETIENYKLPNSVGIIVGIENYDHLSKAPYAENDAELMGQYFEKRMGLEKVYVYKSEYVKGYFFDDIFNPETGDLQKAIVKDKKHLQKHIYFQQTVKYLV